MTGRALDFALEGEGFFTVSGAQGETLYTRCGLFSVSVEDGGAYLVTQQGYYVLDDSGGRIGLPATSKASSPVQRSRRPVRRGGDAVCGPRDRGVRQSAGPF